MTRAQCQLCGGRSTSVFAAYEYDILACQDCSHQFADLPGGAAHVDAVYSDSYFSGGGAGYPDYLNEAEIIRAHGRRYAEMLRDHAKPGRLLDVGAAAGFVLQGFQDCGWSGVGLEPNHSMARYGRENLGLDIRQGTLEDFRTSEQFDLITLVQVIGHLYDVSASIDSVQYHCKPGGFVLIEYWDRSSWLAKALGKHWHEYSPPSVVHWFNQADLDLLMQNHGFNHRVSGRPKKYIDSRHVKSLLAFKTAGGWADRPVAAVLRTIPDGATLRHPCFDLFWTLYQCRG